VDVWWLRKGVSMISAALWDRCGVIFAGRPQSKLLVEVICLRSEMAGISVEADSVNDEGRLEKTLVISAALNEGMPCILLYCINPLYPFAFP